MPKKLKPSKGTRKKSPKPKAASKSVKTKKPIAAKARPAKAKGKAAAPVKSKSPPPKAQPKAPPKIERVPSKQFTGAVAALEAGIKLMYAEDYAKAVKAFNKVIAEYPEEPEIQASAKARIQACEKKLQERARTVFKSADDHYNVAVALMNSGDLETALTHLQSALKLAPKADHILYAMAAANALQGNRDQALNYLRQSIHHRAENRFQALQDNDFAVLAEEQAFKDLVAPPDK
jgi:tetratricopeptide (TPR) repeat protein